jgi:filamentous hemagglutinin
LFDGAIVIAGAISKKIPGGKQLVDKISSIVDKKKKVRTSKVGDKVRVPSPSNIKDFVTLPRNQGYKNKYTDEIWKKSNTNHSGSVGGEWKVGLGKGKIPTKSNKITVSGTGIILKINK